MSLGPQARRAYQQLHERITTGLVAPGTKLPPQAELAPSLGVSLLTLRQALAQLGQDGLIACEHGRGTFVRAPVAPIVLILEDDGVQRTVLAAHVQAAGCQARTASTPQQGVAALEQSAAIALVLTDLRVPAAGDGIGFIQVLHRRWPRLPVVAVTSYPDDLMPLQGRPEHPVLILTKPVVEAQIRLVLSYTLGRRATEEGRVAQRATGP
jgi:CheY-like chemotaxis protein